MHKEIKYSQITEFDKINYMKDSNIYKNPTRKTSTTKNKQQGQLDFVYNHLFVCHLVLLRSSTRHQNLRHLELEKLSKIATASSLQRSSDNIAANLLQAIFIQSNYTSWYGSKSTVLHLLCLSVNTFQLNSAHPYRLDLPWEHHIWVQIAPIYLKAWWCFFLIEHIGPEKFLYLCDSSHRCSDTITKLFYVWVSRQAQVILRSIEECQWWCMNPTWCYSGVIVSDVRSFCLKEK